MNYDGYGELGLIQFGLLLLICSCFERIMFMGYGLWVMGSAWQWVGSLFFLQYQSANTQRYGHIISGVFMLYSLLLTIYLSISTWLIFLI